MWHTNKRKETTITLTCLRCGEKFESEDKRKNRFCKNCKSSHVWREGPDFSTHPLLRRNSNHLDY